MDRQEYLDSIKEDVKKDSSKRGSKVHTSIEEIVSKLIDEKQPTTIKRITSELSKTKNYGSYVRKLVQESETLEFVKVNGINIIVNK